MTTYADCLDGICPCAGPERPPACHECPSDGLTDEEREIATYVELNRPYENDEGLTAAYEVRA